MKKVLLYSGGTDSWLINELWKPDVLLYIDVHGAYSKQEKLRLPKDTIIVHFPYLGLIEREDLIIPLRNLYFLMIASNYGDTICLGATKGDRGGKDKRPTFFRMAEKIINYCLNGNSYGSTGKIKIVSSFYNLTKPELLDRYLKAGGNIVDFVENTFSCYSPEHDKECLHCKPCYRKFLLGYYHGYNYSEQQKDTVIKYLKEYIIPNKATGTYFTKRGLEGKIDKIAVDKLFKEYELDWRDFK